MLSVTAVRRPLCQFRPSARELASRRIDEPTAPLRRGSFWPGAMLGGIMMRKLLLSAVIGVALFATAHAADLATIVAGDPVMPWVIAAVTWVAFWSGLLALVWSPKRARER